jgi:hypothetical protein
MTAHKDLKTLIRERQSKTGESHTAARAHVMRASATSTEDPPSRGNPSRSRLEAIVPLYDRCPTRTTPVSRCARAVTPRVQGEVVSR